MANEQLLRDQNHVTVLGGITDDSNQYITMLRVDPTTKRLLVAATGGGGGGGTVTIVSVVTANGVSGSVATATTTPAITLTLGAITPTSVNGNTITTGTGTLTLSTFTLTVAGNASVSGTNTGDQTNISGNAGTVTTNANLTGPITSVGNTTSIASQTGTGTKFVVDTSPTLVTPVLGVATATSINKVTITAPASSATLTLSNGSSLITSGGHSITFTSTNTTNVTLPTTGTFSTLAGTETLTNKTFAFASNTVTGFQNTARAYPAGTQTISTVTVTQIVLDTESYDQGNNFGSNVYTAPVAGTYSISACVRYQATTNGKLYQARIHKNGSELDVAAFTSAGTNALNVGISTIAVLDANDTIGLYTYHDAGVNQTTDGGAVGNTFLVVSRIA